MAPTEHFKLAREGEERVNPIELILDVVFVLAFSEITAFTVREHSWLGVLDAVLILAMLWRGWFSFAWLTSIIDPNSTAVRIAIFTSMSAFVVMALIIPQAFGNLAGLEPGGPLVFGFAIAYIVVRLVHLFLGVRASRDNDQLRSLALRAFLFGLLSAVLLLYAPTAPTKEIGYSCWIVAVVGEYVVDMVIRQRGWIDISFHRYGWRLMPGHFAERHGLMVIIALGETILAAGVGADLADANDPPTLALAVVSVLLLATLWGAYFDGSEIAAERALVNTPAGKQQIALAFRAYTLLHLPIVVGIVFLALGPKSAIAHPYEPLEQHTAYAFFGGLALFLISHVAFTYLTTRRLDIARLIVGLIMVALIAFARVRPSWESLVLATAIMLVLVGGQRFLRNHDRASGDGAGMQIGIGRRRMLE